MDRVDFFFRQIVTEAELDEGFDKAEAGDNKIMSDQLLTGVLVGGEVAEHFAVPDLTVDIAGPCVAYDQEGRRMFFSPLQVLNMAADENGVSTAVAAGGNEKTLAIFMEFDRSLSDPRLDGNSLTVFYQRTESFKLNVVQSAEAAIAASVPPPLRADQILLADVVIINAQVAILDADIDDSRREDVYDLTGAPNAIKAGRTHAVLQAFLDLINSGAAAVAYGGGPAWHDGTTNPATTVEGQLDKIITDLVNNAGADRIGAAAGPAWHDATANPADSIETRLDKVITDLVANNGADRIGVLASTSGVVTAGGSIHDAINELEAQFNIETNNHTFVMPAGKAQRIVGTNVISSILAVDLSASDVISIPIEAMTGDVINGFWGAHHDIKTGGDTVFIELIRVVGSAGGTVQDSDTSTSLVATDVTTSELIVGTITVAANERWLIRATANVGNVGVITMHDFFVTLRQQI